MTLLTLFGIVLACGIFAALIRAAPATVVDDPFKTILVYILLVIAVCAIVAFFLPGLWSSVGGYHVGR